MTSDENDEIRKYERVRWQSRRRELAVKARKEPTPLGRGDLVGLTLIIGLYVVLTHRFFWPPLAKALNLKTPGLWFNDDAFITFRYAKHIAEGHGYVWNIVDPVAVEGSTSLGWCLLNALGIAMGFSPLTLSHYVGLASAVAAMIILYLCGRKMAALNGALALFAVAFLAFQRQWIVWGVSGMETRTATLLVFVATLVMIWEIRRKRRIAWISAILFFLATIFRPEAPLLHLAAAGGAFSATGLGREAGNERRTRIFTIVTSGLLHGVLLLILTLGRFLYFGKPLPNTFYAKVGAAQFDDGIPYLWNFLWQTHAWTWLPLLVLALLFARGLRRLTAYTFAVQIAALTLWLLYEGGGRWEFRFFDVALPPIAWLTAIGLAEISERFRPKKKVRRWMIPALLALLLVAQLSAILTPFRWFGEVYSAQTLLRAARVGLQEGSILSRYLGPNDRICTGWAGAIPYVTDAWHFDPWGLNDPNNRTKRFDPSLPLFHQRYATWEDVVAADVTFVDIYNDFLWPTPYPDGGLTGAPVTPWAKAGEMVYSIKLPEGLYFIFSSPRPREDIVRWARERRLTLQYSVPLPAGVPQIFRSAKENRP